MNVTITNNGQNSVKVLYRGNGAPSNSEAELPRHAIEEAVVSPGASLTLSGMGVLELRELGVGSAPAQDASYVA